MKVKFWDWKEVNVTVVKNGRARTRKAAEVLAKEVRSKCKVGTESHPMYKKGKFAGQPWTKRDGGSLKRSVRVTELKEEYGVDVMKVTGIGHIGGARVYIGNWYAYYAQIVEYYDPFLRPAAEAVEGEMKSILENG